MRRIAHCSGAFASYLRSAEHVAQGAQRGVLESKPQKRGEPALFPLPLPPTKGAGGAAEPRIPPNGRARSRALKRRAVRQLQAAMVHFLNFEASGRKREATPTTRPSASEAQKRALACLEGAARAMLCAEVQRCRVATLALGRGKIAAGREAVAMIRKRVSEIALKDGGYRISAKVAELQHVPDADRGDDVDISRVKLPPPGLAATVPVAELLTQTPELLAAYETPSILEHDAAALEAQPGTDALLEARAREADDDQPDAARTCVPDTFDICGQAADEEASGAVGPETARIGGPDTFDVCAHAAGESATRADQTTRGHVTTGTHAPAVRACSRLPPEELPRALEALDKSGMLAAVRRGSTSARCGLFCVRKE